MPLQAVRGWHGVTLQELADQLGTNLNSGWANDKRIFDQSNLRPDPNDPLPIKRLLNAIRWELEGGGPINDIGYDEQVKKRMTQDRLNRRLAMILACNKKLYGRVLALSGTKLHYGAYPYIKMDLASQVAIVEKDKQNYINILDTLNRDIGAYEDLVLIGKKPMDIQQVIEIITNSTVHRKKFTGFDLDFDTSFTKDKLASIDRIIKYIKAPAYWLRIAVTMRPLGSKKTLNLINVIPEYIIADGRYTITDLAAGPVFTYHDTSTMAVLQIIATRR